MEVLNADVEQTREVGVDIFALFNVSDPQKSKNKQINFDYFSQLWKTFQKSLDRHFKMFA